MGSLCGWIGGELRPDASIQTITSMLGHSGAPSAAGHRISRSEKNHLAIKTGIYATHLQERDGVVAALVGSPQWLDGSLAELAAVQGPATALIRAFLNRGKAFLEILTGPFALAVTQGDTALIAIDRIGIHTMSYAHRNGAFVFSTSTAAVISHPAIRATIDPQAIFNYFYFHDIPAPGTAYRDVKKVLPAQYVYFNGGHIEQAFYWRLHYNDSEKRDFRAEKAHFTKLLRQSVKPVENEIPAAAFLSGGTDSSTVTGMLAEELPSPVNTYSIGFSAEEFDEMEYARLAARHFGAKTHEYYLKPDDILEAIPVITKSYDEPFGNDSAVPTYFCAKMAAQDGVKVMLAGDGGDEIFGGNARYAKQMVFELYNRLPGSLRNRLIEPLTFSIPGADAITPVRKLTSYISQANIPLPERMESYNFIHRQPLEEMFRPEFLSSVDPGIPEELLRDVYFRADSSHPVNRMLHLDLKFTLADNDLRKVSRMCEVAGVEVRYPILNEALVKFSAGLPPNYKVRRQQLRWFFKKALKDFLPEEIIRKSKHGFGLPFGIWSLSHPPLRDLVDNSLTNQENMGFLQPEYIRGLRRLHAEEHPTYYGKMVWVILMLDLWLEAHA